MSVDPMGGPGALSTPRFFLPIVLSPLVLARRAHWPPPLTLAATRAMIAVLFSHLPAMQFTLPMETLVGPAHGSGNHPGSTFRTSGRATVANSLPPQAATSGGGSTTNLWTPTAPRLPAAASHVTNVNMLRISITLPLLHQFEGAVGKAERLGRAVCR